MCLKTRQVMVLKPMERRIPGEGAGTDPPIAGAVGLPSHRCRMQVMSRMELIKGRSVPWLVVSVHQKQGLISSRVSSLILWH